MSGGRWVFVCGPSGAGKDSVIGWARAALAHRPSIVFARRLVTRSAGPAAQDDEIGAAAFERRAAAGGFAWQWQAHGLRYGIDAACARDVDAGRTVVVNGSREHVAALEHSPQLRVVLVTAPHDLLMQRLHARGRETAAAVAGRMERNASLQPLRLDLRIENTGSIEAAGRELAAFLENHT